MYCSNCGKQIADSSVICIHCGVATKNMEAYQQQQPLPAAQIPQQITVVNTNTNTAGYVPRPVYAPVRKKTAPTGLIIAIILFILLSIAAANSEEAEGQETTDSSITTSETDQTE